MGTRSLIHVLKDDGKPLLTLYRQFDGYPSLTGQQIADFLSGRGLSKNGFTQDEAKAGMFNGIQCLAAQLVSEMKTKHGSKDLEDLCGGVYIEPAGSSDCGEEFTYTIYTGKDGKIKLRCTENASEDNVVFDGDPKDFDAAAMCGED